jgi:hypothetical protein
MIAVPSLVSWIVIGDCSGASGGLASSLSGSWIRAFTSVWVKLIITVKKAINWNAMSIMGVMSPSMMPLACFFATRMTTCPAR